MCYSLSVLSPKETIATRFEVDVPDDTYPRYYYISAFDFPKLPVVTNECPRQVAFYAWGLIPRWVTTRADAEAMRKRTMNARAESIFEKPAFRHPAFCQRCLVLVDGFFEWQDLAGKKYPYFIRLVTHQPFALAGLWEAWADPSTGETLMTVSIVTCPASPLLARIHNSQLRMPVVLPASRERQWIVPELSKEKAAELLVPIDDACLEAYTVPKLVPSAGSDANVPSAIAPYRYPELADGSPGQRTLF